MIFSCIFRGKVTGFNADYFKQLVDHVDAFSLMTYDFGAGSRKPGPVSPTWWIKSCVEHLDPDKTARSKILLGINFYGYAFSSQSASAIIGNQ